MNLKARLDIVRDKKAEEYDWLSISAFKDGFSEATDILLPMVLEMREALEFYAKKDRWVGRENSHLDCILVAQDNEQCGSGLYRGGKTARSALQNLEQKIKEIENG